jgi:adenylate cyclase
VQAIVAKLAIQTFQHEQARAMRKKPQDLQAYDYLLQGWAYYQRHTRASNTLAGEMFAKAVALDPGYAAGYVGLGWVDFIKVGAGWTEFPHHALEKAFQNGRKALELDPANASAHALLCSVYTFQNQYELAIREAEQAIELNPNDAYTYDQFGWALLWAGRVDEAVAALEMALRLDSASPRFIWFHLGMGYYLNGQYGALDHWKRALSEPDCRAANLLAAAYADGPREAARAEDRAPADPF